MQPRCPLVLARATVATCMLLALGVGCSDPHEPKPLSGNGGKAQQQPTQKAEETSDAQTSTPSESSTPSPTDGDDTSMGPTEGVGTVTGPPQEAPSQVPSKHRIDVCALIPKKQVKQAYDFDQVQAHPSEIPPMAVPVFGCTYVEQTGKKQVEPVSVSVKVTPDTGLDNPDAVLSEYASGNTTKVANLGDAAELAPVEENVGGQTDQLVVAQSTDRGLSGIIVDGPPGVGIKPMRGIAQRVLDQL